ncbi:DEAD/DEAH box helicase [Sphingomonas sp. LY29]|uniref:DEAD/DEAH box helicase n=1 Tax=Sphingomonas sp. LY29 TaxID=3095341 RepID=UPI002D78BDA1|nr:DEAD/DEAH box helicase [Sphingomonas sp. LY29]WRP25737.1 DEAD/DEAH box helicase [Sphingomonas sp. LY29]
MTELALADGLLALAAEIGGAPTFYVAATEQRAERLARLASDAFPDAQILWCPASDAIAGEASPPSAGNAGARVAALHALATSRDKPTVLIASAEATIQRFAPPKDFTAEPPEVAIGDAIDLDQLQATLLDLGYRLDDRIDEPGEVGAPGTVLDVFPVDSDLPVRIEVEAGRITGLRLFDALSQRTHQDIERLALGRAAEPAVGDGGVSLLRHVPDASILIEPNVSKQRNRAVALSHSLSESKRKADRSRTVDAAAWDADFDGRDIAKVEPGESVSRFASERRPAKAFSAFLAEQINIGRPVIIAGSARDTRFMARRIAHDLGHEAIAYDDFSNAIASRSPLSCVNATLDRGVVTDELVIVAAADVMGSRAERDDGVTASEVSDLLRIELRIGDAVVHEDHGVGILKGLRLAEMPGGGAGETIELEHAKGGIRHVPITDAAKLWRYGGEPDAVTLDSLDGKSWSKRRPAIDAAIAETARAIRALAKEKADAEAPVLDPPADRYERFADGFAFQETADQWKAIEAVRADLASGKPMDRLIVGDVGYGKTEVALRAAARAVLAGKQVALVAPTTLLARQHYETFARRFADLDIKVAMLSRLTGGAEAKAIKNGIADGTIKMVVGTSSIASKTVCFNDLALIIIDEEQRFGSAQKDKLARLGAGHVLRLSATPIPRTLQTALVGLNDLSLIATPPARRVPVRTSLEEFDESVVRAALLREKARDGQSFVVVPRVEDIADATRTIERIAPDQTIVTVHGKMKGDEAEAALLSFAQGDGDILLATSIIETGLDVPRANTMIVIDAHRFGAGQLHQLRGRVGRSSRRAVVLLTTPPGKPLADRTRARLMHLTAQDSLGAGFAVSAHDLDMRGAGDLTSDEQSGHMKLVGVELYQHLLTGVLRELAGVTPEPPLPTIEGASTGYFPGDWIVEPDARIAAYIRLARATSQDDFDAIADELEDRYGALPKEARSLIAGRRLALDARSLGVERIQIGPAGVALTPAKGAHEPLASMEARNGRWFLQRTSNDNDEAIEELGALLADAV